MHRAPWRPLCDRREDMRTSHVAGMRADPLHNPQPIARMHSRVGGNRPPAPRPPARRRRRRRYLTSRAGGRTRRLRPACTKAATQMTESHTHASSGDRNADTRGLAGGWARPIAHRPFLWPIIPTNHDGRPDQRQGPGGPEQYDARLRREIEEGRPQTTGDLAQGPTSELRTASVRVKTPFRGGMGYWHDITRRRIIIISLTACAMRGHQGGHERQAAPQGIKLLVKWAHSRPHKHMMRLLW